MYQELTAVAIHHRSARRTNHSPQGGLAVQLGLVGLGRMGGHMRDRLRATGIEVFGSVIGAAMNKQRTGDSGPGRARCRGSGPADGSGGDRAGCDVSTASSVHCLK